MRLAFALALFVTFAALSTAYAQAPQTGVRYCATHTTGSISHEYCTFTPIVVAAPAVTVTAPAVTVQPAPVTVQPQAAPMSPAKPKE